MAAKNRMQDYSFGYKMPLDRGKCPKLDIIAYYRKLKKGIGAASCPQEPEKRHPILLSIRQYWNLQLICPFNGRAGSCGIYPVRPLACRVLFVTGTAEYCRWGQAREPILLWHPKLNEVTGIARSMLLGASTVAGYSYRLALPEAVDQALATDWQAKGDRTTTGRTDAAEG